MIKRLLILALFLFSLLTAGPAPAQEKLSVAVAANFIQTFKEMAAWFESKGGMKIEATFASSGTLYSQIINGAPYDLFLSADEDRPLKLYKTGNGEKPFVYARGRVVLWSADKAFCRPPDWQEALKTKDVKRVAVANPKTAPYGAAAVAALQRAGLWESLESKIVYARDVAQAFQYATTGATNASFCARSSMPSPQAKKGCFYDLPEAPDIIQSASVLKRPQNREAAERFAAFLRSPEAETIRRKYGYR